MWPRLHLSPDPGHGLKTYGVSLRAGRYVQERVEPKASPPMRVTAAFCHRSFGAKGHLGRAALAAGVGPLIDLDQCGRFYARP
jgi:hypothetical protein